MMWKSSLVLVILLLLASCTPQGGSTVGSNSSSSTNNTGTNATYTDPTFPLTGIFVQEGSVQTKTSFALPVNFIDSFMIRGKDLSTYLKTIPQTTKLCLVGKYSMAGTNKFLLLSAKPQTYTDLFNKTTENYLLVEPSNDVGNQTDCLVINLLNTIFSGVAAPTAHFSLTQACSTCSTAVTSTGLRMYYVSGEEVPNLNFSALTLSITTSTTSSGNTCTSSTACQARGYNCCLDSQCVNDGAIRPGATLMSGYDVASIDVAANPDRFILYPQYYFICGASPGTTTNGSSGGTTDPDYEAQVRILELKFLYECLNKVNGEFSYCTQKFSNASLSVPSTFTPSTRDDINFSTSNSNLGTGNYVNNIVRIVYGGQTLYELGTTPLTGASFTPATANDNITAGPQSILLSQVLPSSAKDGHLYLTYKVDGTCEKVSATMARCTKSFLQSSTDIYSTIYHNSSKIFNMPEYADLSASASVILKVSGIVVAEDATTWTKNDVTKRITFAAGYTLYPNQTIEVTYFVTNSTAVTALMASKVAAQTTVNAKCVCGTNIACNLKPVYNSSNAIIDYECSYPGNAVENPPVNQTVYVSGKNIPHRYYDINGLNSDENYSTAPAQEGTEFKYTNSNILTPNNVSTYIGFNEIYGPFAKTGTQISRPAKLVKVKKDKIYDIYTNSGVFSSCTTCGTDFYTSLQKIFPQNFSGKGGGYSPDKYESSRLNNASTYRAEDALFGRACFVPATMIPWTHDGSLGDVSLQRRRRLDSQHFLYANGYNRDWFGFDYGSLIGSFDGVNWFSIGNQRRIKAQAGKLYLAVNAYFGDLNTDNNFSVTISETSVYSSDIPDHDTESDGAECQQNHICSTDNDCFRQLGYEYTCQNITSLTTSWPSFDATSNELIGSAPRTIISLLAGSNGFTKRCVYRGRGAPCVPNPLTATSSYNGTTLAGTLACSPNHVCQPLSTTATKFNDRIARFANTPRAQNLASAAPTDSDLVGYAARIIGRPFNYYGTSTVPANAYAGLTSVNAGVSAICVPGKDLTNATTSVQLNSTIPATSTNTADKILGVGTTLSSASVKSLLACPVVDTTGNILPLSNTQLTLDITRQSQAITQNMSAYLLNLTGLTSLGIYNVSGTTPVSAIGYQPNACLRTAGTACFSDMECAPSSFIASRALSADLGTSDGISTAEEKFWEEGLICGNPDFKYASVGVRNTNFDLTKNRCCRDTGLAFTTFTQSSLTPPDPVGRPYYWCNGGTGTAVQVAGVNVATTNTTRYSRVHQSYDKMTCDISAINPATKTFALALFNAPSTGDAQPVDQWKQIQYQYKTLDTVNKRMCCTENWVRSFHTENGGGHTFDNTKLQSIDIEMFKYVNWNPKANPTDEPFFCTFDNYLTPDCRTRTLTPTEEEKYLRWAGSLELLGIPQVAVMSNDQIYRNVDANQDAAAANTVLDPDSFDPLASADFNDGTNNYYSAASTATLSSGTPAFLSKLKTVFSPSEFNCCIPTGVTVPTNTTASQCCTGYFANANVTSPRCCLPDYTDITLYLNRYVSSEGGGLPDTAYDPATGYIKDPGQVKLMAAQKNICCSGKYATGIAISKHSVPLKDPGGGDSYFPSSDNTNSYRRFTYHKTGTIDNHADTGNALSKFNAGVRWNNHVYCVPSDF